MQGIVYGTYYMIPSRIIFTPKHHQQVLESVLSNRKKTSFLFSFEISLKFIKFQRNSSILRHFSLISTSFQSQTLVEIHNKGANI